MKAITMLRVTIAVLMTTPAGGGISPAQAGDAKAEGAQIIQQSGAVLKDYFSSPRMQAVRNLMGATRAIYIAPVLKQGGLIVGGASGKGILLRRHGQDWSDPVFMGANSLSVGFQAGVAELQFISMIMTDTGVEAVLTGDSRASSGGAAALGSLGIGGGGEGGMSGGVETLTFALSKGAFFGGNIGTTSLKLLDSLNDAAYGPTFSPNTVLNGRGGKLAEAREIRKLLTNAVKESWGR